MPIFKPDGQGNYYMVDCIFQQKPMEDLYDDIVEKIIENKIIKLVIENNIDTSLKTLLTERLMNRGVVWCEIIEKYNTVKKEEIQSSEDTTEETIQDKAEQMQDKVQQIFEGTQQQMTN